MENLDLCISNYSLEDILDLFKIPNNFTEDDLKQAKALLAIRQGLVNHAIVVDPEINLAATMIELEQIRSQK